MQAEFDINIHDTPGNYASKLRKRMNISFAPHEGMHLTLLNGINGEPLLAGTVFSISADLTKENPSFFVYLLNSNNDSAFSWAEDVAEDGKASEQDWQEFKALAAEQGWTCEDMKTRDDFHM